MTETEALRALIAALTAKMELQDRILEEYAEATRVYEAQIERVDARVH